MTNCRGNSFEKCMPSTPIPQPSRMELLRRTPGCIGMCMTCGQGIFDYTEHFCEYDSLTGRHYLTREYPQFPRPVMDKDCDYHK